MSEIVPVAGMPGAPGRIVITWHPIITYTTPIFVRGANEVPADFAASWAEHNKDAIDDTMIDSWAAVLDSFDTYKAILADPAIAGYASFISPDYLSRNGHAADFSTHLHARRLTAAYDRFVAAIDYLFGAGRGAFEDRLDASIDAYREGARYPLSLTGDYLTGILGAATRQWFFLNSDERLQRVKWDNDTLKHTFPPDTPFLVDGPKWDLARLHANLLVQGGVHLITGVPFQKVHERLDDFLTGALRSEYLPPPDSFIRLGSYDGIWGIQTAIAPVE
jgi:hypothetical protein